MCHLVRFITDRGRGMYCTYTPILGGDNSLVESGIKGESIMFFASYSEGEFEDYNLKCGEGFPEGTEVEPHLECCVWSSREPSPRRISLEK